MKASDPALSVYFLQLDGNSGTEKEMGEVVERGQEEEGKNGDLINPEPDERRTEPYTHTVDKINNLVHTISELYRDV